MGIWYVANSDCYYVYTHPHERASLTYVRCPVAFTDRKPGLIRIISARKANTREETHCQEAVADELGKN